MSWPYLKAAGDLRLPMPQKITALALGNFADGGGAVTVGNARLRTWTGSSEQTVRRAVRDLMHRQLVELFAPGFAGSASTYQLRYPGATAVGGASVVGGGGGAKRAFEEVPERHPNDRSLIPSAKDLKASRDGREISTGRRKETPTPAQLQKLVHVMLTDPHTQVTDQGELIEAVCRACARADFAYNKAIVGAAVNQALAARRAGGRR